MTDDDAPTGYAPTELGAAADETEAVTAWSLDDGEEWSPPRWWTPTRVTAAAVVASVVIVGGSSAVAAWHLRPVQTVTTTEPSANAPTATSSSAEGSPSEAVAPALSPPPLAPSPSRPPEPVALPARAGSVFVVTASGRTACQVTAGGVGCQVDFVIATPLRYGAPANGVRISAGGEFDWAIGDTGQQQYETLSYGVIYRALGWTITPTSEATTFMNDATGHGMTVSVEGVSPF